MGWLQGFRIGEIISVLIILISGVLILVGSSVLPEPEYDPLGPAGVPRYIAYLMLFLAIINIVGMLKRGVNPQSRNESVTPSNRYIEASVTIFAALSYLLVMTVGGISFPIMTFAFLFVAGAAMTHFSPRKIP